MQLLASSITFIMCIQSYQYQQIHLVLWIFWLSNIGLVRLLAWFENRGLGSCLLSTTHTAAGPKYGKLRRLRRLLDFARGKNQELRNVWKIQCSIGYMLSTTYIVATQFIIVFCPLAGTFVRKRIENGGRTFDKRQSWNVNYSFQVCAKYHGGETDFIRAEV